MGRRGKKAVLGDGKEADKKKKTTVGKEAARKKGAEKTLKKYCMCGDTGDSANLKCDAPGCKREYFHLACVRLQTVPSDKFFCPRCLDKMKTK